MSRKSIAVNSGMISTSISFSKRVKIISLDGVLFHDGDILIKSEDLASGYVDANGNLFDYYTHYRNDSINNVFINHTFENWNVTGIDFSFTGDFWGMLTFEEYE